MIYSIYNLLWTLALPFLVPLALSKKRREPDRLGLNLPRYPEGNEKSIWIHALSVGEVISAIPVIKSLKKKYPEQRLILTVKTLQGMRVAEKETGRNVDSLYYMPLDFWWSMKQLERVIKPCLLILVETDIWPGMISCLKKKGVKIILINGRISPGTYKSYRRFRFLWAGILNDIDLYLMQSGLDSRRLLAAGVSPEKVHTVGNIKFDREWPPIHSDEKESWLKKLNLPSDSRNIIAGSTHEGEEEVILDVFVRLRSLFPDVRLIIAPRKPERAQDILKLIPETKFNTALRNDPDLKAKPSSDIIVIDSLGELGRLYSIAHISFVGGSLVPVGGHNLLEPAVFGRPVLFGKHTHNFVLMSRLLAQAGGGLIVENGEDLFITIKELLSDSHRAEETGKRARQFVMENSGALARVMNYLGGYIG